MRTMARVTAGLKRPPLTRKKTCHSFLANARLEKLQGKKGEGRGWYETRGNRFRRQYLTYPDIDHEREPEAESDVQLHADIETRRSTRSLVMAVIIWHCFRVKIVNSQCSNPSQRSCWLSTGYWRPLFRQMQRTETLLCPQTRPG